MYPLRILHRKITIIFSYIQQFKQKNAKLLIFQSISIFQRSLFCSSRGASPEARYSRRACAQVCAHARHANIIYIYYSVNGSITKRASESVKKRTYNLPSLTYARNADISNTNTCGSTLDESTASIFWYNTTSS